MTEIVLFYVWQSDRDQHTNKGFIQKALDEIEDKSEQIFGVKIIIDHDMKNTGGSQSVPEVILEKIRQSDIMVVDLTSTGKTINQGKSCKRKPRKNISNFNAIFEMGFFEGLFAKNGYSLEEQQRVIFVNNTYYGSIEKQLAFDVNKRHGACRYFLNPDASEEEIGNQYRKFKDDLIAQLKISVPYVAAQKNLKVDIPKPDKLFPIDKPFTTINYNSFLREEYPIYWPKTPLAYLLIKPLKPLPSKFDFITLVQDLKKLLNDQEVFSPFGQRPKEDNDFQLLNEGILVLNNPRHYQDNKRLALLKKKGFIWGIDASIMRPLDKTISLNLLRSLLIQHFEQYLKFASTYLKINGLVDLYVGIMGVEGIQAEVTNLKDQQNSEKYGKFRYSNEDGIFAAYPSSNILQNSHPEHFQKAFKKVIEEFIEPFYKEVLIAANLEHIIGMPGY